MRRLCIALLFLSSAALADGAFPNAMQLLAPPGSPHELRLGTTFGLVTSLDDGATWSYVCEPYIAAGDNVILYARAADGTLLAMTDKLWRSPDSGCTWTQTPNPRSSDGYADLFADPTSASRAFAVSFTFDNGPRALWESSDGAQSFPQALDTGLGNLMSVESSVSDPRVIYAVNALYSGSGSPLLARSGDAGATWTSHAIPAAAPVQVRILQVSPDDANTLWLRATNVDANTDELLATSDGGATFTVLAVLPNLMTGFARTSDGTLFYGDGNPGVLAMAPGAAGFTRRSGGPHVLCLTARGARLFACGSSLADGYNLAYSDDAGASWSQLLSFPQIQGPAACVASACASDWVYQQTQFASIASKPGSGCASFAGDGCALFALLAFGWRGRLLSHRARHARRGLPHRMVA